MEALQKQAINVFMDSDLINLTAAAHILRPWQEKRSAQKTISRRVERDTHYETKELERIAPHLKHMRETIDRFFDELENQRELDLIQEKLEKQEAAQPA